MACVVGGQRVCQLQRQSGTGGNGGWVLAVTWLGVGGYRLSHSRFHLQSQQAAFLEEVAFLTGGQEEGRVCDHGRSGSVPTPLPQRRREDPQRCRWWSTSSSRVRHRIAPSGAGGRGTELVGRGLQPGVT